MPILPTEPGLVTCGNEGRHELFEEARRRGEWTITDLWVQYLAVGGGLDLFSVEAYLHGLSFLPPSEQNLLATALNERLDDLYRAVRLPYLDIAATTKSEGGDALDIIYELLGYHPTHDWGGPTVESTAGRLAWLEASVDVGQQLLSLGRGVGPVAQDIIEHVRRLSHARTVTFVGASRSDEDQFDVRLATGVGAGNLLNKAYDKARTLEGRAMQENRGFLSTAQDHYSHHLDADVGEPAGPLLAVPFDGPEDEQGAIIASRGHGQKPFSAADLAMALNFARQCGIALRLLDAQASREQLRFREQRDAETRLLHDNLIQQLFGLGVTFDSHRNSPRAAAHIPSPRDQDLWRRASSQIDTIISQLRSTLTTTPDPDD